MTAPRIWAAPLAVCGALAITGALAFCQEPLTKSPHQSVIKTEAVEYLYPEQIAIPARKSTTVLLHFRIQPNLHINSHAPREKFLIPTVLSVPESSGVRLAGATYPAGTDFTLPADPDQKLSVYTGEFAIQARLEPDFGEHLVEAKLRYQACDQNSCMPPKTITVPIDVIGK